MKKLQALLILVSAGCGTSHVYGGPVNKTPSPLLPGTTAQPDRGPLSPRPTGANPAATRLACRGSGYPSGWVAVTYTDGLPECAGAGEKYSGALLQRHDLLSKDTELYVCADQRIPGDWVKLQIEPGVQPGERCPSSEHPGPVADRVMLLRKVR